MKRIEEVIGFLRGNIICLKDGVRYTYETPDALLCDESIMAYALAAISAENGVLLLELVPWHSPITDMNGKWVQEHIDQTGSEPSYF